MCREHEAEMTWKNATAAGENERRCDLRDGQEWFTQRFAGHGTGWRFYPKCDEKPQGLKQKRDMT